VQTDARGGHGGCEGEEAMPLSMVGLGRTEHSGEDGAHGEGLPDRVGSVLGWGNTSCGLQLTQRSLPLAWRF
jgi:hypothetical protein